MKKNIKELDLFKEDFVGSIFGEDLLLVDNFHDEISDYGEYIERFKHPQKLTASALLICICGTIDLGLNLKNYTVSAGSAVCVTEGNIVQFKSISDDCKLMMICFKNSSVPSETVNAKCMVMFMKYFSNNLVIKLQGNQMAFLMDIYMSMKTVLNRDGFMFKREALLGYWQVLIAEGCQWISDYYRSTEEAKPAENRQRKILEDFLQLVGKHCTSERSTAFYAEKLCITPKYLGATVMKLSGRTTSEWIRDYVILEAKALLRSHRHTVQQISEILHFANPSFFGKYFKAAIGMSPRKYMME